MPMPFRTGRRSALARTFAGALLLGFGACGNAGAEVTKVACVGDSITFGAAIKDRAANCYPAQLGRMLGGDFEVRNFGNSGSTMLRKGDKPYWQQREYRAALDFAPDIVVIKLGTNDTKPQNWSEHGEEFAADYRAMIDTFRALPSKPTVYVCLPIPVFRDRWGITEDVTTREVIPAVRGVAKGAGCPLIDLYAAMEGKGALVPDGVHPNGEGATILAETVAAALREAVPAE